jgi:uncharacterized protein YjbI with pentapeptide repeats
VRIVLYVNYSNSNLSTSSHNTYIETEKSTAIDDLIVELKNVLVDLDWSDVQVDESRFSCNIPSIASAIVNAKKELNGIYSCNLIYSDVPFLISQSGSDPTLIIVRNLNTNEENSLENVTFPELKNAVIKQYIKEQYRLQKLPLDLHMVDFTILESEVWDKTLVELVIDAGADFKSVLTGYLASKPCLGSQRHKASMLKTYIDLERLEGRCPVDLTMLDLADVNFSYVDFTGTLLSVNNVNAIINGSGDLSGALIDMSLSDENNQIRLHCLDKVSINKCMAIQLIAAGVNPRTVLVHYLATERRLNHVDIDISGINLTHVDSDTVDLRDVNLKGIQFAKTRVSTETDEIRLQANFEHDLLTLLTTFSETVASVVTRSATRDIENNLPEEVIALHRPTFAYIRQSFNPADLIKSAIKTSTGNCQEMAHMGKYLVDFYLGEYLRALGYKEVSYQSSLITAQKPEDHAVILLRCTFKGQKRNFIIDPWSGGKAWTYLDGLNYLRTIAPHRESSKNTSFNESLKLNADLESWKLRSSVHTIFDQFGIKELLNLSIKENKSSFVGLPMNSFV